MKKLARISVTVAGALLTSCAVDFPPGWFACDDDSDCQAAGYTCVQGRCWPPGEGPDAGRMDAGADGGTDGSIDSGTNAGPDGGTPCAPDLRAPANGSVDRTRGEAADVATYACDEGYVLTGNDGSNTRTCLADGTWSGSEPSCARAEGPCTPSPCLHFAPCALDGESFTCDCAGTGYMGRTCEVPIVCSGAVAPVHGRVSATFVTYPDFVTYECDAGYTIVGSPVAHCRTDGTFSEPSPICAPNPCAPELTAPANGSVDRATGVTGDVATYACDAGYMVSGDATRTCEPSGAWSGSAPSCVPSPCSPLTAPANGSVDRTTGVTGDMATYACSAGYTLSGSATRTCQTDGTWTGSAPTCTPNPCPTLTPPTNGSVNRTSGVTGDVAVYSCNEWYRRVGSGSRTCQTDGTWSGSAPTCVLAWTPVSSGTTARLRDIWGSSSSDIWAVGDSGTTLLWNGVSWLTVPSGTSNNLFGVWTIGSTTTNRWAVGQGGTILRFNGTSWSAVASGSTSNLVGVSGITASNAWAVETTGNFRHWNGTSWTGVAGGFTSAVALVAVSSSSFTNAWAVGGSIGPTTAAPATTRWNGSTWSPVAAPGTSMLWGVWTDGSSDTWAVGDGGIILRWNGFTWSIVPSGTTHSLHDVWGAGGRVWAVGANGTILHWSGTAWSTVPSGTTTTLRGVWGTSGTDVLAVGDGGTILRYMP